jgi:hypothetical protein
MIELLSKFPSDELIGLVAVVGGLLIGLICGPTAIIGAYWIQIRQMALKQEMLNRGMSADEIRMVVDAGSKSSRKEFRSDHSCHA